METNFNQNSIEGLTDEQKKILMAPVFIVGSGRSGTTWLQRLLLEHPEVAGGQESEFFLCFSSCLAAVEGNSNAVRKLGLPVYWNEFEFFEEIRGIWMRTFIPMLRLKPQAHFLSEKTPSHAFHMNLILKFLPNAKFIHIIRDSRSVVSSMIAAEKSWGSSWAPSKAKSAAIIWWRSVIAARNSGAAMPSRKYLEICYEDLLADTSVELSKIYDFIGVDCDPNLLEEIVSMQSMQKLKQLKGTGFNDREGNILKEPEGFFRKGMSDSWKKDLSLFQKLVVWRYTRKLMKECGYNWKGRMKEGETTNV